MVDIYVGDKLMLTIETRLRNITHSMLDSPYDTVHEQLELLWRYSQQCREAIQVDCAEQFEEPDTVLGELGKVLVDHVERRLKDRF